MKSGETKAFSQVKKSTVTELKQKVRDIKTASPCFVSWMIRKDGLYLQGNRGQLLAALQNYQHRFTCLIRLQTAWRTYLARSFYKFKQPRKICANETDFCTMDPIDEIPTGQLICVQHSPDSPHYGFNIISLLNYFYKSRATLLSNPFNRDPIPLSTIFKWICLARILDPTVYSQIQSEPFYKYFLAKKKKQQQNHHRHSNCCCSCSYSYSYNRYKSYSIQSFDCFRRRTYCFKPSFTTNTTFTH